MASSTVRNSTIRDCTAAALWAAGALGWAASVPIVRAMNEVSTETDVVLCLVGNRSDPRLELSIREEGGALVFEVRDRGRFVIGPVTLGLGAMLALMLYPATAAAVAHLPARAGRAPYTASPGPRQARMRRPHRTLAGSGEGLRRAGLHLICRIRDSNLLPGGTLREPPWICAAA